MQRQSLYFTAPFQTEIRSEALPALKPDQLLIETHFSAVSAGTEMLLYRGEMPMGIATDTTIDVLAGTMQYPLKYGYSCVGQVIEVGRDLDSSWRDQIVFAFNPHETHFITTPDNVYPVPNGLEPHIATLLPNMETAVSFVMDGQPIIGERVVVFGQGIVGLLTTALLAKFPLAGLITVEQYPKRKAMSLKLGADQSVAPNELDLDNIDLVYELTGKPSVVNQAVDILGYNGRVIIGSWYGTKTASIQLGDHFHRNGIQIVSSQVSALHPRWRGRWTKRRRLEISWEHLLQTIPRELIDTKIPFIEMHTAYQQTADTVELPLQTLITYKT